MSPFEWFLIYVDPVPDDARREGIPGIFLNTLPKSASIYIWEAFTKGLGLPKMRISGNWFPGDNASPELVESLAKGGVVSQEHVDASWRSKAALAAYLDKMVVHVRDPRSSALEWAYHLLTLGADNNEILAFCPKRYCPAGFHSLSREEQIGIQVDNFLPDAIRWVEGWVDAADDPSFRTQVLIVQYEEFVADEPAYYEKILDFYGIDRSLWTFTPFTPTKAEDPLHEGQWHFRNKRTDEWRDAFTPEQLVKASAMIPEELLTRFGWPAR